MRDHPTPPIVDGPLVRQPAPAARLAVILHHAVVETGATVGANAVVPNGMTVPAGSLALGVPAAIHPGRSDIELIDLSADQYVANGQRYREELARVD